MITTMLMLLQLHHLYPDLRSDVIVIIVHSIVITAVCRQRSIRLVLPRLNKGYIIKIVKNVLRAFVYAQAT